MAPLPLATVTQHTTNNEKSTNKLSNDTTATIEANSVNETTTAATTVVVTTVGVTNETTTVTATAIVNTPAALTTTSKVSMTSFGKKINAGMGASSKKRSKASSEINIVELKAPTAQSVPPVSSTIIPSNTTSIIVETNSSTNNSNKTVMVASPPSPKPHKILLKTVNPHITCNLCKGYLIDATTIVECLHSFCHSCLMKHLRTQQYCPRCEMMINKAKPNIKPDATLQAIAYKLVPGIYEKELLRKRAFYNVRPDEARLATPEQRGEDTEHLIFNPTEKISLSLEYADIEDVDEDDTELSKPKYLHCPAIFKVSCLKKFILLKFGIDMTQFHVEIMYKVKTIVLPDYYTLMDVAYIYTWKRDAPMRFFYRVRTNETISEELPEVPLCRSPNAIDNSLPTAVADVTATDISDPLKIPTKIQKNSNPNSSSTIVASESTNHLVFSEPQSLIVTGSDQILVKSDISAHIQTPSVPTNVLSLKNKETKDNRNSKIEHEEATGSSKEPTNKLICLKSVNDDSVLVLKNKSKQKNENRRHSMGGKISGSSKSSDKLTKLKIKSELKNNLQPKIENIKLKIDWSKQVSIVSSGSSYSASSTGKLSKAGKSYEEKKMKHSKKMEKLKMNELQNKSSENSNIKVELIKCDNQNEKSHHQQQVKNKAEKLDKVERGKKISNKTAEEHIKTENKKVEIENCNLDISQYFKTDSSLSSASSSQSTKNIAKMTNKNLSPKSVCKDNSKSPEKNKTKQMSPLKIESKEANDNLSPKINIKIKSELISVTDPDYKQNENKLIKTETGDKESTIKIEQPVLANNESEEQKSQFLNSFELTPRKSVSPPKPKDVFLVPALPLLKKNLSPPLFATALMKPPSKRKNHDPIRSVLKKNRMDNKSSLETAFYSNNSLVKDTEAKNKKPSISFDLSPYPIGSGKSESMPPPALPKPKPKQSNKSHERLNKLIVTTSIDSTISNTNQSSISSPVQSIKSNLDHALQPNGVPLFLSNGFTRDMMDKSTSLHPAIAMAKKGASGASPIYAPQYPNFMQGASKNKYPPLLSRPKTFGQSAGRVLTSMKSPRYTPSSPIYSPNSPQYNHNYNIPTEAQYKYMKSPNYVASYANFNLGKSTPKPKVTSTKADNKSTSPPIQEKNDRKLEIVPSNVAAQKVVPATSGSPPLEPMEKQEKVQSLLSSCNINFPSSLSITLTNDQNDSNSNSFSSSRRQSPVNNYIEIVKLPDTTAASNSSISPTLSSGLELNSENSIIFKPEKSSLLGIEKDLLAKVNELKNKGTSGNTTTSSSARKNNDVGYLSPAIASKNPIIDDTKFIVQSTETVKSLKQVPNLNPIEKKTSSSNINQSFAATAAATALALLQQNEAKKETFQQQFLQSIKERERMLTQYKVTQSSTLSSPVQSVKTVEKISGQKTIGKKTTSPRVSPNSDKKIVDSPNDANNGKKNVEKVPENFKMIRKSPSPKTYEASKKKKLTTKCDSALDLSAAVATSQSLVALDNSNSLAKLTHENNINNLMPHPSQFISDLMQRNAVAGASPSGQQSNPALYLPQLGYNSPYMSLYFLEQINRMQKAGSEALDNYVKNLHNKTDSNE